MRFLHLEQPYSQAQVLVELSGLRKLRAVDLHLLVLHGEGSHRANVGDGLVAGGSRIGHLRLGCFRESTKK